VNTFGENLLAAIEARAASNPSQYGMLRDLVRDALGIAPEAAVPSPSLIVMNRVPAEFPQFRIKYSPEHEEIARRRVNSLEDLGKLIREDYSWASATPVPAEGEV
jgi:hypothetical protein